MRHSWKHHRLGRTSSLALAIALAVPAAVALPAVAQAQEAAQQFDIPAGDLSAALERYSAQTGMQLVYSSDLIAGKRSPGASGRMSPQQALGQLLAGSGLSARVSGNSATLVQAGASGDVAAAEGERLLGPVRVEGSQGSTYSAPARGEGPARLGGIRGGQADETIGYRAKVVMVGGAVPTAIEDVPRSVTVTTQDQLRDQDITSIGEVLNRLPGVTVLETDSAATAPQIYVRGFQLTQFQVDGGAPRQLDTVGNGLLNLDAFERVELVRGPNGANTGAGSPGGSLNLVRKRPGEMHALELSANIGSYGRQGVSLDYTLPDIGGSGVSVRAVASLRDSEAFYDNFKSKDRLLYLILDTPIGSDGRFELGAQYTTLNVMGGYQGIPRYIDGPVFELPQDYNYVPDFVYRKQEAFSVFGKIFAQMSDNIGFEMGVDYSYQKDRAASISFTNGLSSAGTNSFSSMSFSNYRPSQLDEFSTYAKINGTFDTFGLAHNLVVSASYSERRGGFAGGTGLGVVRRTINSVEDIDPSEWDNVTLPALNRPPIVGGSHTQTGLVFSDVVSWRNVVDLTFTLRRDQTTSSTYDLQMIRAFGSPNQFNLSEATLSGDLPAEWRPSYAIAIKPVKGVTLFGSYSDGFTPQGQLYRRTGDAPNFRYSPLTPAEYKNREIGIKANVGGMLLTATGYKLSQSNVAFAVDGTMCPPSLTDQTPCYDTYPVNQDSEGIDVEIAGSLGSELSLVGSLNYGKSDFINPFDPTDTTKFTRSPSFEAKFLVDWKPEFLPGSSFMLSGRYRGTVSEEGSAQVIDGSGNPTGEFVDYSFSEKPYLVLDAGLSYRVLPSLEAELFIENIFDKEYYSTTSRFYNFVGAPRSVLFTLRYKPTLGQQARKEGGRLAASQSRWYGAIEGGLNLGQTLNARATGVAQDETSPIRWNYKLKQGYATLGRVGYGFDDHIRGEFELAFRSNSIGDVGGGAAAPFGACGVTGANTGVPFDCDDVGGKFSNWSFMTNVLYDFLPSESVIRPFIGAGAGIALTSVNFQGKMEGIGSDAVPWANDFPEYRRGLEAIVAESQRVGFAWQLVGGASIKISDRMSFELTYRRFSLPAAKWGTYNLDERYGIATSAVDFRVDPLTGRVGDFKSRYSSNNFTVGAKVKF